MLNNYWREAQSAMCFALYLGSEVILPTQAWNEEKPAFYVEFISGNNRVPALSKTYIYYLGSHQGCGCGFLMDGEIQGTLEYETVLRNYSQLADYLDVATQHGTVKLFMTWEGEEAQQPQDMGQIFPSDIRKGRITFVDGHIYTVSSNNHAPEARE